MSQLKCFKSSLQHLEAESLRQILDLRNIKEIFTVVRHPFDRFVSEYFWQVNQGITALSPREWIEQVKREFALNSHFCDNHFRQQVDFILPGMKVFHFSSEVLSFVSQTYDLQLNVVPSDKSTGPRNRELVNIFQDYESDIYQLYKLDYMFFAFPRSVN